MEIKTSKRLPWVAVLLIVAVICTGAFLLARYIVEMRQPTLRHYTALTALPDQNIKPLGSGLIYYDGATLHALNARGQQIWTYLPSAGSDAAASSADYSVGPGGVAAWSGKMLTLLDASGNTLFSGEQEQPILSAYLGTSYAAVQLGEEHDSTILLMEPGGRKVDSIDYPNNTVMDYGFFSGGSLFWAMTLNTEGTSPMCSISTYRPGKMLLGTVTDSEQILYRTMLQSSQIRAVGSTYLRTYDYSGKEVASARTLVYGWYLMSVEEDVNDPLMAFVPVSQTGGESNVSDVRLIRSGVDVTIRLPAPCFKLYTKGDALYAFTNQHVLVYRIGDDKPVAFRLPMYYIEGLYGVSDGNQVIVSSGGATYFVQLP